MVVEMKSMFWPKCAKCGVREEFTATEWNQCKEMAIKAGWKLVFSEKKFYCKRCRDDRY